MSYRKRSGNSYGTGIILIDDDLRDADTVLRQSVVLKILRSCDLGALVTNIGGNKNREPVKGHGDGVDNFFCICYLLNIKNVFLVVAQWLEYPFS